MSVPSVMLPKLRLRAGSSKRELLVVLVWEAMLARVGVFFFRMLKEARAGRVRQDGGMMEIRDRDPRSQERLAQGIVPNKRNRTRLWSEDKE